MQQFCCARKSATMLDASCPFQPFGKENPFMKSCETIYSSLSKYCVAALHLLASAIALPRQTASRIIQSSLFFSMLTKST
jgi:hypothetical protein